MKAINSTYGINNFFTYVFSMTSLGIIISCLTGIIVGNIVTKVVVHMQSIFPLLAIVLLSEITSIIIEAYFLRRFETYAVRNMFLIFLLNSFLTGISMAPYVIIGNLTGFGEVIMAFGTTTIMFIGLTIYASLSGKDFRALKSVLVTTSVILVVLGLVSIVSYWFFGVSLGFLDFIGAVVGLFFSSGFVLYNISRLSKLYSLYSDRRSVMNLGLFSANILLKNFSLMFRYIFSIIHYINKRKEND